MTLDLRLRAYAPNGADLGVLPTPQDLAASFVLNDVGGLTLSYGKSAPRADLLGQPVEVAVEASHDGGAWAEVPDGRFVYLRDESDPTKRPDVLAAECPSYVWRLIKAYVGTLSLNAEGKRQFTTATAGAILKTLLDEAQTRGALAGITHSTFSATTDSAGLSWGSTFTIAYEPTVPLLTVLLNLAQQGVVDFRMVGRDLRVYKGGASSALATDRTTQANPVILHRGRDLTEAPSKRTWEGLTNAVLLIGDEGVRTETTNTGALAPWGRWEGAISHGGVSDEGTISVLSTAFLNSGKDVRQEFTNGLDFGRAKHQPFRDYAPGEYVFRVVGSTPERLRVRAITLTRDERRHVAGNVVLNDRFLEAEIRLARRVAGIVNGSAGGTGGLPAETPPPPAETVDNLAPAVPTGLNLSSVAYLDGYGNQSAQITASWAAVTTNSDGSTISDLAQYVLRWRYAGVSGASLNHFGVVAQPGTTQSSSPFPVKTSIEVAVQALDRNGNASGWSPWVAVTTSGDDTAPDVPSTPTVTEHLGQVKVRWDGLTSTGGTMPLDLDQVEVHLSTSTGFTPSTTTLRGYLRGAGEYVVTDLTYGTSYYARLVAVDRARNKSAASATSGAIAPARVSGLDLALLAVATENLGPEAVDEAKIKNLAVTTAKIALLAVKNAQIADLAVDDAKINNLAVGKITAGKLTALYVEIGGRLTTAVGGVQSGSRLELDGLGLRAYQSGTQTVQIGADGAAWFQGTVQASDVTTRATPTSGVGMTIWKSPPIGQAGATFHTSASAHSAASIHATARVLNSTNTANLDLFSGNWSGTTYNQAGSNGPSKIVLRPDLIGLYVRDTYGANLQIDSDTAQIRGRALTDPTYVAAFTDRSEIARGNHLIKVNATGITMVGPATAYDEYVGSGNNNASFLHRWMTPPVGGRGGMAKYVWDGTWDQFEFRNWPDTAYIRCVASAFISTSDEKWKADVTDTDCDAACEAIQALTIRDYTQDVVTPGIAWEDEAKTEPRHVPAKDKRDPRPMRGIVAQEAADALAPSMRDAIVTTTDDGMGVDLYGLLSTTVAALQSALARIEVLEQRVPV